MAIALVTTGEGDKASRWMLEASEGITREDLLHSIVTKKAIEAGDEDEEADPVMRFYLICVQLLEQTGLGNAALRVALVALNSGKQSDPLQPTMWSIVTKLHLQLGHYQVGKAVFSTQNLRFKLYKLQEAYEAIISNPDSSQRPESLDQLRPRGSMGNPSRPHAYRCGSAAGHQLLHLSDGRARSDHQATGRHDR